MKKTILSVLLTAPLLVGCVNIEGSRTAPDGSSLAIKANRFLWASQNMEFTTEAEGVKVSLKAEKSSSDTDAVKALADIATSAIQKAP